MTVFVQYNASSLKRLDTKPFLFHVKHFLFLECRRKRFLGDF